MQQKRSMAVTHSEAFDLVIVGGGIAGAGVAQASSAAGYRVLLLEKEDYGSQTSAHSSKLIHGGLRYLETFQFGLVRDSLKQRRALLRLAPTLVKSIAFYIPVYGDSRRGKWMLWAGLSLYAALAGFEKLSKFKQLPKSKFSKIKGLKQENLKTVFEYGDAKTDDQLLTQAVIKSAQSLGALTRCPANFESAEKIPEGYQVHYQFEGETYSCQSKCIINAAGPWVNKIADCIRPDFKYPRINWVKGSHIIIEQPASEQVFYLESKLDQRVIFVIPWHGKTLIGTTEVMLENIDNEAQTSQQEIEYLLKTYRHYFPHNNTEIASSFAGVRVLPANNKKAFNRSRESKLWSPENHPNLRIIYGGKLTTFRTTAREMVTWLQRRIGERKAIADVDELGID
jgi:glycerol-3-phosphate dehydrogenase